MWFKRELGLNSAHAQAVKAELYAIDITFLVLATLSVVARLVVRIRAKTFGLEDWLAVAAQVRQSGQKHNGVMLTSSGLSLCQHRSQCNQ